MNLHQPDMTSIVAKWHHVIEATSHINTWTTDRELSWIADYATWCSNYLEIGSYRGRSAKVALMANPGLKITCLDTWDDPGTFEEFQHNLGPEIASGRVIFIRGSSQGSLAEGSLVKWDGCFIDGGHEEHLVKADIDLTRPFMKPGSWMAGHDWAKTNDVARGVLSVFHGDCIWTPCDSIWTVKV